MRILSEGIPMTCGEVYALVRRRRDERTARQDPPFGLQHAQADPRSGVSSNYLASRFANGPTNTRRGGVNEDASSAVLSSNSSQHLSVLLAEVQMLCYLLRYGGRDCRVASPWGARGDAEVKQQSEDDGQPSHIKAEEDDATTHKDERTWMSMAELYGPPSIYSMMPADGLMSRSGSDAVLRSVRRGWMDGEEESNKDDATLVTVSGRLENSRAGTAEQVHAVDKLLHVFERRGSYREALWAGRVKDVLRGLNERRQARGVGSPGQSAEMDGMAEGRRPNLRPMLSHHTSITPLVKREASSSFSSPTSATEFSSPQDKTPLVLSEGELMQVVAARPSTVLEVHRVIDGLEERLGNCEEDIEAFVEELISVFRVGAVA